MFGRRWIGLAVAALLVIVVISAANGSAQQNAWMQGYMAGRLSAGSDGGAAALAPYMMPGGAFGPHFGGAAPGLLLGLGFLALGFFALTRGHGGRWQQHRREWHEQMRQRMGEEARRWHDEGRAPWERQPEGDASGEQRV